MNDQREDDRRRLEGFFRDELRAAQAEAPSFDDLAAYVEGRLPAVEAGELEERIAGDEVLRREVELLSELRLRMASPSARPFARRRFARPALAAAAVLVAAASWLLLRPSPRPGFDPPPTSPAPVASVTDGGERLVLSADGTLDGLAGVAPDLRAAAAEALRGALPPPDLRALRAGRSVLMGEGGSAPAFGPEAPVGLRVSTPRPTFRWTRHPDATAYEVKVFDRDFNLQASSGPVAGAEWQPTRPLPAGRVLLWQVTARTGHGRLSAPAAPQPEARFEVADGTLLGKVAERRRGAPSSHLVAALAFLEAGLLDDAQAELEALAAQNPGAAPVTALPDRLAKLR